MEAREIEKKYNLPEDIANYLANEVKPIGTDSIEIYKSVLQIMCAPRELERAKARLYEILTN